jgi:hypothetical protein
MRYRSRLRGVSDAEPGEASSVKVLVVHFTAQPGRSVDREGPAHAEPGMVM